MIDGQLSLSGIHGFISIERDSSGVPTIHASNRNDAAFALGFLHAQERFFQMDLLRRKSAGRLSELFGERALPLDVRYRRHPFQKIANEVLQQAPKQHQDLLDAYTHGVNAGISRLSAKPFEYTVLGVEPKSWNRTDSILVMLTMMTELQQMDGEREIALGALAESVPDELFDFVVRSGSRWDAPLDDSILAPPMLPDASIWSIHDRESSNTNLEAQVPGAPDALLALLSPDDAMFNGSNHWAIAAEHSKHGHGILASDMHLSLGVPATWYRAVMRTPCLDGITRRLVGVTLPGTPALVEGSNGEVAWGVTNSYGDFGDIIELIPDPDDPKSYRTPEGPKSIEVIKETISHRNGVSLPEYEWTIWGPVVANRDGRRFVHHWVGDDVHAIDTELFELETARTVAQATDVCNRAGAPHLNVAMVDADGNIGWTLCGRIPRRLGPPPKTPVDWSSLGRWLGYLTPEEYPKIFNPPNGRIWNANNRVLGGPTLEILGDGGYDQGGRAHQIRRRLMEHDQFDERDLLNIQLDDEAFYVEPWQELLVRTLESHPDCVSKEFADEATQWNRRASVDSVGYRIVEHFRAEVLDIILGSSGNAGSHGRSGAFAKRVGIPGLRISEDEVMWDLLEAEPEHWLPKPYPSWPDLLTDAAQRVEDHLKRDHSFPKCPWGNFNRARIRHPLSVAIPWLSSWLDMPNVPLAGDRNMPRVQRVSHGASQRMVVSPGLEEQALYHQPGGQSGHPLSPYYRAGFSDWAEGQPSPLLPGTTAHTLRLVPVSPEISK
jgi:penicillin amidase